MPASDHYAVEAAQLEIEISRKGAILGINWNNDAEVRKLARRALRSNADTLQLDHPANSLKGMATMELVGLSLLILKLMKDSADESIVMQGGPIWKALSHALWDEARLSGIK